MGKKENKGLPKRCSIHVHSKRTRLADPDGISAKATIDGLAKAGIFPNDSAKYVKKVSHSQEHAKEDETIIDIVWEGEIEEK